MSESFVIFTAEKGHPWIWRINITKKAQLRYLPELVSFFVSMYSEWYRIGPIGIALIKIKCTNQLRKVWADLGSFCWENTTNYYCFNPMFYFHFSYFDEYTRDCHKERVTSYFCEVWWLTEFSSRAALWCGSLHWPTALWNRIANNMRKIIH